MTAPFLRRRHLLQGAGLAAVAAATVGFPRSAGGDRLGAPARLRLATGPPGGVYRALGGELLKVLAERFPRTQLAEIPTGASVDNLALLADGGTELAFAYLDATVAGLAAGEPDDVTAVARLYDAWMHVIVRASSPVRTFADLDGRAVAGGAAGSGTQFTLDRLVALTDVRPRLVTASQAESADLLAAGRVEAMISLTGMPTPAVTRLASAVEIRMIPLGGYTEAMASRYGDFYAPATLPARTYPDVASTDTFTVPNLLLARPDLPGSVIEAVAAALFADRDRIAVGHPDANHINVRTAIATAPVRLHPGALHYFRSVKR
jgi:uncharacterized protein